MRSWFLIIPLIFGSCEFFQPKGKVVEQPLARSMDKFLYKKDLDGLFPSYISANDSVKLAEKYIQDWVKKQLMIAKSLENINYNAAEIERKVLDYRYALIVHSFEREYIKKNLKLNVDPKAIEEYYQEKSDNFLLKQNIIKCMYAQIPKNSPNLNEFRRNFRNYPAGNMEDIKSYCGQFAVKSFLEDTTWLIFEELILGTPLENVSNESQFLENTRYSETSDNDYYHFLKIFDYKISDEVSPLEFIRENIENIIVNKRKIELKKELEEKVYNEAKKENLFEIYTP